LKFFTSLHLTRCQSPPESKCFPDTPKSCRLEGSEFPKTLVRRPFSWQHAASSRVR
jgi:hypothetical protein